MPSATVGFRPATDVRCGATSGDWIATGDDPQFAIDVPPGLGSGFTLAVTGFESVGRTPLSPTLYVDTGAGFNEATAIPLRGPADGCLTESISLPIPPVRLRLDPTGQAGRFRLASIEILRNPGGIGMVAATIRRWISPARDARMDPPWLPSAGQQAPMTSGPRISVLMPVRDVPRVFLQQAVESVLGQRYPNLELCLVDDGSTDPGIARWVASRARRDPRTRFTRHERSAGISVATNQALEMASGRYVALVDHDDVLHPHALGVVVLRLQDRPRTDFVYTDEDRIDAGGRHFTPISKPDWSPEYFTAAMYTNHLAVYRTALVRDLGGFRKQFDGAQDYDLALRIAAVTSHVEHVAQVLYHWRMWSGSTASGYLAKPLAEPRGRAAVHEFLQSRGLHATVEPGARSGVQRVRIAVTGEPFVSVIVHGQRTQAASLRRRCCASLARSSHRRIEVLFAESSDAVGLNQVARHALGEHLLLLDAAAELGAPDALQELLMYSQLSEIGAVGPRISDAEGRLRQAGLASDTLLHGPWVPRDPSQAGLDRVQRNVSVVSAVCLMTRVDVFRRMGGFDPSLNGDLTVVDYCLRLWSAGKRVVFTPHAAVLLHNDPAALAGLRASVEEVDLFRRRWPLAVERDPFFPSAAPHRAGPGA